MRTAYFPLIGRLGNLLMIYAHARAWCEQNGFELSLDPWIGEKIFTIPEAVRPSQHEPHVSFKEHLYQHQKDLIYTRKQVREWFTIRPELLERLKPIGTEELIFNVRMGEDYRRAGLVTLSTTCYAMAAIKFGYEAVGFKLETDIHPTRLTGFDGDLNACGVAVTMAALPSFYRLMMAKVLFRANSTFSWWAATLGHGKVYSPIIDDLPGGQEGVNCERWVDGNWPVMAHCPQNSDLYLREE